MSYQQMTYLHEQEDEMNTELCAAMALAFSEIDVALKSSSNPHFKSKYADLTAVIDSIKPALIKHGLFFVQTPHETEAGGITLETVLFHKSGGSMSLGKLFVPASKSDAQGYGSALTYARRYGLVTAFGVPQADDDGNAAAKGVVQAAQAQKAEYEVADAERALKEATDTALLTRRWTNIAKIFKSAPDALIGLEKVKAERLRELETA